MYVYVFRIIGNKVYLNLSDVGQKKGRKKMEIKDKKAIISIALIEFQHNQVDCLVRFVDDRPDCCDPRANWDCICNCVDLWRSADEALKLLKEIK